MSRVRTVPRPGASGRCMRAAGSPLPRPQASSVTNWDPHRLKLGDLLVGDAENLKYSAATASGSLYLW